MRFFLVVIALLCGHLPIAFSTITPVVKQLAERRSIADLLGKGLEARETPKNCTPQLTSTRKEW